MIERERVLCEAQIQLDLFLKKIQVKKRLQHSALKSPAVITGRLRNPSCSMLTCQGESSVSDEENNDGGNGGHCSSITFRFAVAGAKG